SGWGPAFEWLAFDRAGERDRHAIVLGRLHARRARRVGPVLLDDAFETLVDFGVGDVRRQFRQLDGLEIAERNRRHDLERHRVIEIALAGDQLLDCAFLGWKRDLRVSGKLVAVLGDNLVVGVANGRLDYLGHRRAAIHTLEVGDRYLAGTESVDADPAFQIIKARIDLRIQFGGGNDDLVFALQAFGQRFSDLHRIHFFLCLHSRLSLLAVHHEPNAPLGSDNGRTRNFP